jgi:hypothetical protein
MFMRFRGGGIGHRILRDVESQLAETDPWVDIEEREDVVMQDGTSISAQVDDDDDDNSDLEGSDEDDAIANMEDDDDELGAEDGETPDYIGEEDRYDDL